MRKAGKPAEVFPAAALVELKKTLLPIERDWINNITITTGLVDTFSIPMLLKTLQSRRIDASQLITHRFRLDKDSLAVRRNEIDATVGSSRTYAEVGYLRLNRDIAPTIEDLRDREELRFAGRVAFARYWSVFGSGVFNLTDRSEDPTFSADGFDPIRTRIGVAYQDDCLELGATWRRDYLDQGDARRGNTFQFYFALRNLGFR